MSDPSTVVWNHFMGLKAQDIAFFQEQAKDTWGVTPNNWFIWRAAAMQGYSRIYGYIVEAAADHGLAPEFVHAVAMGEGLYQVTERERAAGRDYNDALVIDGYNDLGLDELWTDVDTLIANDYLDTSIKAALVPEPVVNELGETKTSAKITGYRAAIQCLAAELAWRGDWIADQPGADLSANDAEEFVTYCAYNNRAVALDALKRLAYYMRKWDAPEPGDQHNVRFNALKRLAAMDWYRAAGVYVLDQPVNLASYLLELAPPMEANTKIGCCDQKKDPDQDPPDIVFTGAVTFDTETASPTDLASDVKFKLTVQDFQAEVRYEHVGTGRYLAKIWVQCAHSAWINVHGELFRGKDRLDYDKSMFGVECGDD